MKRKGPDIHQVRVFQCLSGAQQWQTADEIAAAAAVPTRTARLQLERLVDLGLVDQDLEFHAHRYRLSSFAGKRNQTYLKLIQAAASTLPAAN